MMTTPIDFFEESEPPRFIRGQALPYPDLQRVWARVQLTDFAGHPVLEMAILGPDGREGAVVHASPMNPDEASTPDPDDEEVGAPTGDDPADVVICGSGVNAPALVRLPT